MPLENISGINDTFTQKSEVTPEMHVLNAVTDFGDRHFNGENPLRVHATTEVARFINHQSNQGIPIEDTLKSVEVIGNWSAHYFPENQDRLEAISNAFKAHSEITSAFSGSGSLANQTALQTVILGEDPNQFTNNAYRADDLNIPEMPHQKPGQLNI